MKIEWTNKAMSDLMRLYEFLAPMNKLAAARVVRLLAEAPKRLLDQPRIGEQLEEFKPRDVRRIVVERYEIRYVIQNANIYVLRLWQTREDR